MTLSEWLDVAFAIHVNEAVRMGIPLVDALDKHADWSRINPAEDGDVPAGGATLAAQNERSLREFEAMMAGTR